MNTAPSTASVPLAIVGMGCLFPKADGLGHYWANVKNGIDCIENVPATHWNPEEYYDADPKKPDMTYARRGGFLNVIDFNPLEFGIAPRDIEATDTTQLLGLVAAKQALNDARVDFTRIDRSRVSVILGVTGTLELVIPLGARLGHPKWRQALREAGVSPEVAQDVIDRISDSYVPWQENSFPGLLGNVVAGRIANRLDLHGTNCVVDAACASSLSAVHLAALELATGKADVVVTGGADTFNDIFMFMCFSKTPALSPSGDSKPFDANGDGTILGEGIGVVVLKRLADAERDGDRIYAVIRGIGSSSDGKGNAIYAPSAEGQKRCLQDAYTRAGVPMDTVELIEAHGTGTRVGDATEARALVELFGQATGRAGAARCAIGSVKSQIGHTKAAAGAASLIKVALSLYHKVLPPTLKVSQPVEPLAGDESPFYVNTTMRPWLPRPNHPRRAGLSAFGFGGSNFHAVLEEHSPRKAEPDWDGQIEILALSAENSAELRSYLEEVVEQVKAAAGAEAAWACLARAAELSRSRFSVTDPVRLLMVTQRGVTPLLDRLQAAMIAVETQHETAERSLPEGVFLGRGALAGKVAVLFPGQGSQRVGMLRELACLFPELLDTVTAANAAWARQRPDGPRLSDLIYPPTSFRPAALEEQEAALRDTAVAQPALGAVCYGAWLALASRFCLQADGFAGHSYGELTALTAAGRLDVDDFLPLSCLRGTLMAQAAGGADPGTMLAVFAGSTEVAALLQDSDVKATIANKNSPKQTVLSGSQEEIDRAQQLLQTRQIRTTRLPVAAAFHSAQVADASRPFAEALQSVPFRPSAKLVYSNSTGQAYPSEADKCRSVLGNQLAQPVEFVAEIQAMLASGFRTFIEIGPGNVLSRLVEATVAETPYARECAAIPLESGGKKAGLLGLATLLARLAARGVPWDLAAWEHASHCRPSPLASKPGLTVPVCGANSRLPRPKRPVRANLSREIQPQSSTLTQPVNSTESRPMTDAKTQELAQALQLTQQTLAALQRMQEETAQLHRSFLERQQEAQRTLLTLIGQQQQLLFPGSAPAVLPTLAPLEPSQPDPSRTADTAVSRSSGTPRPVSNQETVRELFTSLETQRGTPTPQLPTQRIAVPPPRMPTATPTAPAHAVSLTTGTAAAAASAASAIPSRVEVDQLLLQVVSEKTGYPAEMLNLDMTLDSDLGVDSIKRVEILSALQEKLPDAPVVKPEHMGTLHSLRDVANYLAGPGAVPPAAPAPVPVAPAPVPVAQAPVPVATVPKTDVAVRPAFPAAEKGLMRELEPPQTVALPDLHLAASAVVNSTSNEPDIGTVLLGVVAEKTGYPSEMLTLDMALDTDLGIDSIKRVEILSALQEKLPSAPVVKPEQLGTLHTLRDVALFLSGSQNVGRPSALGGSKLSPMPAANLPVPESVPSTQVVASANANAPPLSQPASELGPKTEQVSSIKTPSITDSAFANSAAVPGPVRSHSEVDFSLTGTANRSASSSNSPEKIDRSILQAVDIDLTAPRARLQFPQQSEVWLVADEDVLTNEICSQLLSQRLTPRIFSWSQPDPSLLTKPAVGLVLITPARIDPKMPINRLALEWIQTAGGRLRQQLRNGTQNGFIASVARLDGTFGLEDIRPTTDPTSGGLAGLIKTARLEWNDPVLSFKALDVAPGFAAAEPAVAAQALVDEVLTVGPIEVGVTAKARSTPELARTVRRIQHSSITFGPKDVVLVTGGARGVTAEVAFALADTFRPTIVMLGRTPAASGPEPAWLSAAQDEPTMKKAIADNLGPTATPKAVAEAYTRLAGQREIRQTLLRLEQTGARVGYFAADVTNPRALADVLQQVQVRYGPVTALVHGAGVLADKRIEDLSSEQFDLVYKTKVDGLRTLLDLLGGQELKAMILFSSTTARFGRIGQAAYAVANEVLNKTAQVESRRRPNSRVVAINWGPWEGGMVTPALRKVFESEGVGLIPLSEGGVFALQELNAGGRAAEVVALGRVRSGTKSASGTPPAAAITRPTPSAGSTPSISNSAPPSSELVQVFERSVELATHPVLRSHVIDGRAVLPMALHLEWLAHAALHGNPGLVFTGFNEARITNGVMVEENQPAAIRVLAGRASKVDKNFHVPVEIRGKRRDGRDVIHSRAEVVLSAAYPRAPYPSTTPEVQPYPHPLDEIYHYFLFHGPDLHGIERVDGVSEVAFVGTVYPSPTPAEWLSEPLRSAWVTDPLALDASFQMMILWSYAQHGAGSLPCFAGRYRQYRRTYPTTPIRVHIRITRDNGSFARADIDYFDNTDNTLISQIQDYECVIDPQLNQAFRRNQLASRQKLQS